MKIACTRCNTPEGKDCKPGCPWRTEQGPQGDGWRWDRCSQCECRGHVFDGDLQHTTLACVNCGTCEACADCDGCDQPDVFALDEIDKAVLAAGAATASTEPEPDDPLGALSDKLEDLKLAVLQAEAFLKLDESLEQCEQSRTRYKAEHRDLAKRALKIGGELARANHELLVELRKRGEHHRGLAEWLSRSYARSVPPVDVGHGPA